MANEIGPTGTSNQSAVDAMGNVSVAVDEPLIQNQQQNAVATFGVVPASGNILQGESHINAGTILTIPAGKTWTGFIQVSGSVNGGLGAVNALPNVTVQGATAIPIAGSILNECALSTPALLGVGVGVAAPGSPMPATVYAGASSATLQLSFGGATLAAGVANGYLI